MSELNENKPDDAIEDVEKDDIESIANWEELPGVNPSY